MGDKTQGVGGMQTMQPVTMGPTNPMTQPPGMATMQPVTMGPTAGPVPNQPPPVQGQPQPMGPRMRFRDMYNQGGMRRMF
jgi:hypothetical protein